MDDQTRAHPELQNTQATQTPEPDQGSGGPYFPYGEPAPMPAPASAPATARLSRGAKAGILTGALAVGLLGGAAGAAGFAALENNGDSLAGAGRSATGSVVSAREDTPAAAGSVEQVAASVLPSVVKINVSSSQGAGSGSGMIISADGEILTNNHVAAMAGDGGSMTVGFNDGTSARARVIGTDPLTDLAVIKAEGVSGLPTVTIAGDGNLDVGEQVVAIGSPFGLEATVTSGIVSALNRPVSVGEGDGTDTTYPAIQTDAAINPGNSGGPLVNAAGEVVGINSSIRTASNSAESQGGSIGLGFAIPIDKVLPIVEELRAGQTPTHARLGVSVGDVNENDGLVSGAGISDVGDGSSAQEAGIEAGDVVTKVDDDIITGSESLIATIRGHRPGDQVTVTVIRDGETKTFQATLDSDESTPAS